jgi:hypothetical protein
MQDVFAASMMLVYPLVYDFIRVAHIMRSRSMNEVWQRKLVTVKWKGRSDYLRRSNMHAQKS